MKKNINENGVNYEEHIPEPKTDDEIECDSSDEEKTSSFDLTAALVIITCLNLLLMIVAFALSEFIRFIL